MNKNRIEAAAEQGELARALIVRIQENHVQFGMQASQRFQILPKEPWMS